jgi:hypothetical protein
VTLQPDGITDMSTSPLGMAAVKETQDKYKNLEGARRYLPAGQFE